jgi:putative ABC transport system permease protein
MLKNHLKVALRNVLRQKGHSLINIVGLAIGMACCILIAQYVAYELSFDRYHEKAGRVYRVAQEFPYPYQGKNQAPVTPAPMAPALVEEFPEVISATRLQSAHHVLLSRGESSFLENNFYFADPQTFEIFSFDLLKGDPETALDAPYSIILSESMAEKYFGDEDPMGNTIRYKDSRDFTVTGILKNMRKNSHFIMDFVIPFETYGLLKGRDLTDWGMSSFYSYILLREGADPLELERKLPSFLRKHSNESNPTQNEYFLQPLTKIHLRSHLAIEMTANGDIRTVYLFTSIAVVILILACINYMNLATARSAQRGKEVGIRKAIGAQRGQLVRQFLGESMILTFIALFISIVIAELVLPTFNSFVERDLGFSTTKDFKFVLGMFVLAVFVGVGAGTYPAVAISSFKPVSLLGGRSKGGSKSVSLRGVLVIIQFCASIVLIISTLIVRAQLEYIKTKDVGYTRDEIVVLEMRDGEARMDFETIKAELQRNPDVLSVSSSSSLPGDIGSLGRAMWPGKPEDVELLIYVNLVNYDFVDLYGMQILEGRNFSREYPSDATGAFLLNETAARTLGWDSPIGREFIHRTHVGVGTGKIVGIVRDFHLHSLHQRIEPLYLYLDPRGHYYLSVKIRANRIPETVAFLREKMQAFSPAYPFEYSFFDDIFDRAYQSEEKLGRLFGAFTLIAIVIACLGLLGLTSFTTERRTREIGIRKAFGASVSHIVVMLSRELAKWVLIANVIAWPLAYFAMSRWLQDFEYRTSLGWWTFILAGILALFIAMTTVSFQTVRAALTNPVETLRYE